MKVPSIFIGFDGFIDEISRPIAKKAGSTSTYFSSIVEFSEFLKKAAGKSCNIELAQMEEKLGGNGPNTALALATFGHSINIAGTFGKGKIHPIFNPLMELCQHYFSLENPGYSDALEFPDGKIILGKHAAFQNLTHLDVIKTIGEDQFFELLDQADLFISGNWTMLQMTNSLWAYIITNIAPRLTQKKRLMFVDLADPAKRSDEDLMEALNLLKELNQTFSVNLGLNQAEASRIAQILGVKNELQADTLFSKLNLSTVVIHSSKFSSAKDASAFATYTPPFNHNPKITTGAGDNFNAGFCHAKLQGQNLKEALIAGNGAAGFYIQEGRCSSAEELAIFIQAWDKC